MLAENVQLATGLGLGLRYVLPVKRRELVFAEEVQLGSVKYQELVLPGNVQLVCATISTPVQSHVQSHVSPGKR
jgi:hypothetical protein